MTARKGQRSRKGRRKLVVPRAFVEYMKFHRYRLGLTQKKMAKRIGIKSQGYYCEIEKGEKKPDPEMCTKIADAIGRPVEEVIAKLHGANLADMGLQLVGAR